MFRAASAAATTPPTTYAITIGGGFARDRERGRGGRRRRRASRRRGTGRRRRRRRLRRASVARASVARREAPGAAVAPVLEQALVVEHAPVRRVHRRRVARHGRRVRREEHGVGVGVAVEEAVGEDAAREVAPEHQDPHARDAPREDGDVEAVAPEQARVHVVEGRLPGPAAPAPVEVAAPVEAVALPRGRVAAREAALEVERREAVRRVQPPLRRVGPGATVSPNKRDGTPRSRSQP